MARRSTPREDQLDQMVSNWHIKTLRELGQGIGVEPKTIVYWAMKLRKAMKAQGMSDKQINDILPPKNIRVSPYEVVAARLKDPTKAGDEPGAEKVTVIRRRKKAVEG